jgi:phosphohistidine phosphatase SixA
MDLFLLRHAIAEPAAQSGAGLDRERRLTPEGEEKMREIAEGMKVCELEFDLILSSPYVRGFPMQKAAGIFPPSRARRKPAKTY